jgi:serine/threonine-protein kinase
MNEIQGQLPILTGNRGSYKLLRLLGRGSFGDAFLAIESDPLFKELNPRQVVVKRLRTSHHAPEDVPAIKQAFEREAKVLWDLGVRSGNIPSNIPRLYDYFSLTVTDPLLHTTEESYYLVEQYIAGEDLSQELKQQGRFSEEQVLALLNNILPVLKFIHNNNVIHRDIKPSNIMHSEEEDNKFYLIDFGAVKQVIEGNIDTEQTSMVFGTPAYAPLEQIIKKKVDYSSDLYALAASCVELLTGESHKNSRDVKDLWNWQRYPYISGHLGEILRRMLQEDIDHRFQSAQEVMEALNKRDDPSDKNHGDDQKTIIIPPPKPQFIQILLITAIILTTTGVLIAIYRHQNPNSQGSIKTIPGQLFEDKQFGIEIKYPQDWKAEKQEYSPLTGGTIAKIFPNTSSLNLEVGLFIRIEDIQKSQTLSEYNQAAIEQIKKSVKNVQILEQQSKKIDNREGYQIVYTGQDQIDNFRFKVMKVWTISNSKVYILTYRAEEKLYDPFLKDVEQTMIKSFRLQLQSTLPVLPVDI